MPEHDEGDQKKRCDKKGEHGDDIGLDFGLGVHGIGHEEVRLVSGVFGQRAHLLFEEFDVVGPFSLGDKGRLLPVTFMDQGFHFQSDGLPLDKGRPGFGGKGFAFLAQNELPHDVQLLVDTSFFPFDEPDGAEQLIFVPGQGDVLHASVHADDSCLCFKSRIGDLKRVCVQRFRQNSESPHILKGAHPENDQEQGEQQKCRHHSGFDTGSIENVHHVSRGSLIFR